MIAKWLRAASGVLAMAFVLMAAMPAQAQWRRAESDHFVVYGAVSEGALRAYTQKLERLDSLFRRYYPILEEQNRPKLHVYLANGTDEMRRIVPGLSETVAGFYSPGLNRVFAVANLRADNQEQILFHEYGHHVMFYMASNGYPGWFVEGFAEYYSTVDLTPGRTRIGRHSPGRMNSLTQTDEWLPMTDLLASRRDRMRGMQPFTFYAQAWAVTHYFMSDPQRQRQLGAYLGAVSRGGDPVTAMQDATGLTPEQMTRDIQRYLRGGITYFTLQETFPEAEVTITLLPAGTRDLIWMDLRLDRGVSADDRDAVIREARAMAARWPGERLSALVLARAELMADDALAAEAALAPLLATTPDDPDALRLSARALMKRAEGLEDAEEVLALNRQARRLLAQAYQADPMDFRIVAALDETRRVEPDYPTANDLATLDALVELAPQVKAVRTRAARVFMDVGDYRRVIAYITPVANDPHGGSESDDARAILAEAEARAAGRTPPAPEPEAAEDAPQD